MRRQRLSPAGIAAALAVLAAGCGASGTRRTAENRCQVEGVWEAVSVTADGHPLPPPGRPARKILAWGHSVEVGAAARRDTLPLRDALDTLRSRATFGAAGRYVVAGDTLTQTVDIFSDPALEGRTLTGPCRTVGDTLYYEFTAPAGTGISPTRPVRMAERWRRVR